MDKYQVPPKIEKAMKCEVQEDCSKKVRYIVKDLRRKKTGSYCMAYFEQGMRAWLEPDPIIRQLKNIGIL